MYSCTFSIDISHPVSNNADNNTKPYNFYFGHSYVSLSAMCNVYLSCLSTSTFAGSSSSKFSVCLNSNATMIFSLVFSVLFHILHFVLVCVWALEVT